VSCRGPRAAAVFAPADEPSTRTRSNAGTWRERPRDLAALAITPAATAEVAHATRSLSPPETKIAASLSSSPATRRDSASCFHRPSDSIVRFAFARSRRSALLRPRCARLTALTSRSANLSAPISDGPTRAPSREPRTNCLTTPCAGVIVEFSSTVAPRIPLRIDRCGAHESLAPGHGSFSSLDTLPGCHSRDNTSADHATDPVRRRDLTSRRSVRRRDPSVLGECVVPFTVHNGVSNVDDASVHLGRRRDPLAVLLTVDEAATLLRTTRRAIYAMIERRQLPGVIRIRRRVLFRADDLLHWLDQKRAPSPEE
jgi:excisionase family DNA binding protein